MSDGDQIHDSSQPAAATDKADDEQTAEDEEAGDDQATAPDVDPIKADETPGKLVQEVADHPDVPHCVIITLVGAIDAATATDFRDELEGLQLKGVKRFILDMEGIRYVNSTGLGALVRLADQLENDGGGFALIRIHPKVKVVFDMLGLNAFFKIFPNLDRATEHLRGVRAAGEGVSAGASPQRAPMPLASPAQPAAGLRAIQCKNCGVTLRITQPGNFRCSRCQTLFTVPSGPGEVSFQMPSMSVSAPAPAMGSPMPQMASAPAPAMKRQEGRVKDAIDAFSGAATTGTTPVEGPLSRQATVRYFERMNPFTHFPVVVILSQEAIEAIAVDQVAQVTGEQGGFEVAAEKPIVEVVPQFPGCHCVPDRLHVDVSSPEETVTFWVTPQTSGKLDRAAVEIWYEGERVETIKTPCRIAKRTMARVAAFASVMYPLFSSTLETMTGETVGGSLANQAEWGLPMLAAAVGGLTNLGFVIGGLLAVVAAIGWWLTRPLQADPVRALLETGVKQKPGDLTSDFPASTGTGGADDDEEEDPSRPLPGKTPVRQMNFPFADPSVNGVLALLDAEARAIGIHGAEAFALRAAIRSVIETLCYEANGGQSTAMMSMLVAPMGSDLNIKFADKGRTLADTFGLQAAREFFHLFDHRPHPQGGNIITLRYRAARA